MIRKDSSILGIDLHDRGIRVVQVRCRANKWSILKVGHAEMPIAAMSRGRVLQPGAVAVALRQLIDQMGVGNVTRAVVGVQGDGTSLRTIAVPPAPDADLASIVEGEVSHYGLIRTEGGTYAFVRLHAQAKDEGTDSVIESWDPSGPDTASPSVVSVVVVDGIVITSIREAVERANLTIEAIEPVQYAMLRSVMASVDQVDTLFALMVGPSSTDVAFVNEGKLVALRRIDVGSMSILQGSPTAAMFGHSHVEGDEIAPVPVGGIVKEGEVNHFAVDSLATEIRRTLSYYEREYSEVAVAEHMYVVLDNSDLEPVVAELNVRLGTQMAIVRPTPGQQDAADVVGQINDPTGSLYSGAFGLALQGPLDDRLPRLDLYSKERYADRIAETRKNFRGSIWTSFAAIVLGIAGYFLYGRQIQQLETETSEIAMKMAGIKADTDLTLQERHRRAEQYKAFRKEGVPVAALMDSVVQGIEPQTGLTSVIVSPELDVTIEGESAKEASMISTMQTLQRSPMFSQLRIVSFTRLTPDKGDGIGFQFSGKTFPIDRLKLAEEKKQ